MNKKQSKSERVSAIIRGAVQGVGFRPFVYRLATELGLTGWVVNSTQGVFLEVEGDRLLLEQFIVRLQSETPPRASIQSFEFSFLDPVGYTSFEIRASEEEGTKTTLIVPDIATCPECIQEIFDPSNRRYLYPFTNCTNCGPRFTILEVLPYDRQNTTMKNFTMCPACLEEYRNPSDRRYHAQPNACPVCGPHLELWDSKGSVLSTHHEALQQAAEEIRSGRIVAVKGIGGFHLIVDARNEEAVALLRQRKRREEKPFALMMPTLEIVQRYCNVNPLEERLLRAPEAPIVILEKKKVGGEVLAQSIAPGNPYLGIMLPYSPLHHILMHELGFPIVATSGNLSDEPICIDEREAVQRLNGIADVFLVHNRPIARHVDDSVVRIVCGRELILRRARGYAPLPIRVPCDSPKVVLAVGAHLKNTIALTVGSNAFISQHIGDLETEQSFEAFQKVIHDFQGLYATQPTMLACDRHPEYLSTTYAFSQNIPVEQIQHHYAHVLACIAENHIDGEVLGIAWDGTGYGLDGTIWGGEFLLVNSQGFERVATFRPFMLVGGEQAVKEPRRSAFGVLYELFGDQITEYETTRSVLSKYFSENELTVVLQMAKKRVNAPWTSSVGRLFDAVAALLGLRGIVRYEGQAAMELEFHATSGDTNLSYPLSFRHDGSLTIVDWEVLIHELLRDRELGTPQELCARKFHNALVDAILAVAQQIGIERVVLSGGCFQNKLLTERAVEVLRKSGLRPYWHQRVPPNDGGIALGQALAVLRMKQ